VRASPAKFSFNAGEISVLFQGRIDYAKYGVSMRQLLHFITTPQGPLIRTGGTQLQTTACYEDRHSALVPYVFADEQALMLEFADFRLRFHSELGLQTFTPVEVKDVISVTPFIINSPDLTAAGGAVGKQIVLTGFSNPRLVNDQTANIIAKAGDYFTLDLVCHGGGSGPVKHAFAALVYHVDMPYGHNSVRQLVGLQDVDVMYLFCPGFRPRKLSRFGAYDWRLTTIKYVDGPFAPVNDDCPLLTPDSAGIATVKHTTAVSASGTASGTTGSGHAPWMAFDYDRDTYWQGTGQRNDTLTYHFAASTIIEGYVVHLARNIAEAVQLLISKDFAPSTWVFEGSTDGITWITLDTHSDFELYTNYRTPYIKFKNKIAYDYYRLKVTEVVGRGNPSQNIFPSVGELIMRKAGDVTINFTAASINGVNRDRGFLATDVGRLIRVRCEDNFWRSLEITAVTDTTHITAKLQGEPLLTTQPIREWRMGYFSDTTGWPVAATWFADRLALGGITEFPTLIAMSEPGDGFYDIFSPTDGDGTVNDDNGIAALIKTRDARIIRWLASDDKALLIGTSGNEWALVQNTDAQPFSARNIRAKPSTRRGSAAVQPVEADRQILFVDALKRTLYEHAYEYQSDGYESPSLSILASHIGVDGFEQLVYAQAPHSLVWCRRAGDDISGLTYNRKESVTGWHTHNWAGGKIESVGVLPSLTDKQHTLWMVAKRIINGQERRFIERLSRFWDFGMELNTDAFYVACGLRAQFLDKPTDSVYVPHLIGERVQGIIDGQPFGVDNEIIVPDTGLIELPDGATDVVIGLPMVSQCEISSLEAGASDGTSQGKWKRIDTMSLFLWDSAGGEIGVYDEDHDTINWQPIEYPESGTDNPMTKLFTGVIGPFTPPQAEGKRGTILLRQREPLPFNVIAMYPRLETVDG
jgi:hypothetical protein